MASLATRAYRPLASTLRQSALQQNAALRVASFHTTSRRDLLPPGPQVVKKTVNDPTSFRDGDPAHGSYHWTFDRLLALGLVPLCVTPFASGSLNPGLDALLCATILVHSHLGFQNIIADYVPSRQFPKSRKAVNYTLGAATLLAGVGLYEFETNDVGVTEAIKRVWKACYFARNAQWPTERPSV
ncbi:hypothetical protein SAPIO_CDS5559 [Scedosporium apiospermum]|uniref:Succinate dehydrogenase [ubiquinone] cytochrome b small subunit n=1 Tax=Pseudallescheria apiosperma TaxID=563466 RepID=A0A084G4W7_PSEDA|nr:uncharacterized protein SAPIO_CDS5559 [Scedosporium apiospermum]KEZ42379.1 hypothetical protein SAPIO_CDS5559 [Scedosporium apiospermum]